MSADVRLILAISRGDEVPRQFLLGYGEAITVGRSPSCEVVVDLRGASARHAEIFVELREDAPCVCVRDRSTNGTGTVDAQGEPWVPLRSGETKALQGRTQLLVPFNRKAKELAAVVAVRVVGQGLPDAYDERTGNGRWTYKCKLGEGALGVVHRAADATGVLQDVAIKIAKLPNSKASARARNTYILHREALWSKTRLHNRHHPGFQDEPSKLFIRYLEDHTGDWGPEEEFEARRAIFEAADFVWDKYAATAMLPATPYVVMELAPGRTLHSMMGWGQDASQQPLGTLEKQAVAEQAAEALKYLQGVGLVHRDFRTTNLMVAGRGPECSVRVIDLGHTIAAEEHHKTSRSAVVKCSWKETKSKRFDWAPTEVKEQSVNFEAPTHSFDVHSLAVLLLQLECGSMSQARSAVQRLQAREPVGGALGLGDELLGRMLGPPATRPHPALVAAALQRSRRAAPVRDRSRSRSRPELEVLEAFSAAAFDSPEGSDTEPE